MAQPEQAPQRPVVLITGGWKRIGAEIARAFAADGWDLALHGHTPDSTDHDLIVELEECGAEVRGFSGDLAELHYPEQLLSEVVSAFERAPLALVNNASLFRDDRIETLTTVTLDEHMRTNFYAPLLLTKAFAAALANAEIGGRGSVAMLLDQRVRNPVPDQFSYSMSKQALHAAVRTLARSLAPKVRVNGVAPGPVLPTDDYSDDHWDSLSGLLPLNALPSPQDIASAVLWLAKAPAVTGQTVFVDGGANLEAFARDFVYLGRE